jgi:signal transduction histidine kinase
MIEAFITLAAVSTFCVVATHRRTRREQRATDLKRQESDELVRAILNATSHLIVYTGTDGLVQALNPAAAEALGCSEAEAVGLPVVRLFDQGSIRQRAGEIAVLHDAAVPADFGAIVAGVSETGSDDREWVFRRWDGRRFPVQASTTALYAADGSVRGYAVVASDVSARHEAEAAAQRARDAAKRANTVKSEFLANMSHELRTPLNSVIGFANILLKNKHGRLAEQDLAYLDRIGANGRHLLSLINGILDLSKIEAGRVEVEWSEVNVTTLVRETLAELESQALAKGLTLVAELPSGPALLRADTNRVKQMLINLVANAIKFTDRGEVRVRVCADADGRVGRIEVLDTGCGIPADRIDAIFDAFRQADSSKSRRYEGTGLGLTITRSLAQMMGLDVTVSSKPGSGSTFGIAAAA